METTQQQRRSERVESKFLAEWFDGQYMVPGEVRNISLHGLFVETSRPAAVGQILRMALHLSDGLAPLECFAFARFCDAKAAGGLGIELFGLSHDDLARWSRYYYKCSAAKRQRKYSATLEPHREILDQLPMAA